MNYRIEKKEAFTTFGVEGIFTTENGENLIEIPKFWSEAMKNGTIDKIADATGENWNNKYDLCPVNAVCDYRKIGGSRFAYMLCAFKTSKSVTEGFTVADIPAATWAIFTSEEYAQGEIASATQDLIKRVYTEWLPTAGYDKLEGYEFEMYYTKENGKNYTETWIRVAKKLCKKTY